MHIAAPLSCQGFYATRIIARRIVHALMIGAAVASCAALGTIVAALALLDFVGAVTWGK